MKRNKARKVKNRRNKAASSGGKGNSKYARKLAMQKSGRFSLNSPFSLSSGSIGIPLQAFNKMR